MRSRNILHLALAGSVVFVTGVLDDRLRLSAWKKLAGIAGAAVLAYTAGIRVDIPILHGLPAWPGLGFVLTVLWLIGCTNAFNLIDGMDGLAAGVGLVATVTMVIAALIAGQPAARAGDYAAGRLPAWIPALQLQRSFRIFGRQRQSADRVSARLLWRVVEREVGNTDCA